MNQLHVLAKCTSTLNNSIYHFLHLIQTVNICTFTMDLVQWAFVFVNWLNDLPSNLSDTGTRFSLVMAETFLTLCRALFPAFNATEAGFVALFRDP